MATDKKFVLNYPYALQVTRPQHRHLNHQRFQAMIQYNIGARMADSLVRNLRIGNVEYVLGHILTSYKADTHPKRLEKINTARRLYPDCPEEKLPYYLKLKNLFTSAKGEIFPIELRHLDFQVLTQEIKDLVQADLQDLIPYFQARKAWHKACKEAKKLGIDPPVAPPENEKQTRIYYWLRRLCYVWVEEYSKAEIDRRFPTSHKKNAASRSRIRFAIGGGSQSRLNRATHPSAEQKAMGNQGIPRRKRFYQYTSIDYQEQRPNDQIIRQVKKGYQINIPCLPQGMRWVPMVLHRPLLESAKVKHIVIKREDAERRWYAILQLEVSEQDYLLPTPEGNRVVGIDPGQKTALTAAALDLETGEETVKEYHWNFGKLAQNKKAYLQRRQSRMRGRDRRSRQKPSTRWLELQRQIRKLDRKITNQRKDTIHKITRELACTYTQVGIGNYTPPKKKGAKKGPKGIVGARKQARDLSLATLKNLMAEKAERAHIYFTEVDERYTTQECHSCHFRNTNLTLQDREWTCPQCGLHHRRDVNSAINIRNKMLQETPEVEDVQITTIAAG